MNPLRCEITGKDITSGYWSPASGFIYDKAEIEERLRREERDPLSHRALKLADLVPIHQEFDIDSFASSVELLYRKIEYYKDREIKNDREIKTLRRESLPPRPNQQNDGLIKKTYEAKLENLEKEKNREISDLQAQVATLKSQLKEAEEDHQRKRIKMMDAVKEREEFWKRKLQDEKHNARR